MLNTKEKSLVRFISNIIGRKPTVLVNDFSNSDSISSVYVVIILLILFTFCFFFEASSSNNRML